MTREFNFIKPFIFLLFIIMFFNIDSTRNTFKSNDYGFDSIAANKINKDLINQLKDADFANSEIILYVPTFGSTSDLGAWPYPAESYTGERVSNFAYKYGITNNYVFVKKVIATKEKDYLLH